MIIMLQSHAVEASEGKHGQLFIISVIDLKSRSMKVVAMPHNNSMFSY